MRHSLWWLLRAVLVLSAGGSLVVQLGLLPVIWLDMDDAPASIRVPLVLVLFGGVACFQVVVACLWRLLGRIRAGTVFVEAPFRLIDVMTAAIAIAACLTFSLAVIARAANHMTPGDAVAPGLVALVCGAALVIAGVAMVVQVLRTLLAQAVALDARARDLATELDGVV
jgi:hypothetical protein